MQFSEERTCVTAVLCVFTRSKSSAVCPKKQTSYQEREVEARQTRVTAFRFSGLMEKGSFMNVEFFNLVRRFLLLFP